ncbi:MAG: hypothetical protein ACI8TQ_002652 [Planctomycetota bacterium]|jgi:hypothetical protein
MSTSRELAEEPRTYLRRIIEAQAYRQLMAMNIRGHCLKYLTDVESKMRVAEELHLNLAILREVRALYQQYGWEDVESVVRDRMTRIPYPESGLEFKVFRHICGLALKIAMDSYVDCSSREFAAIARSFIDGRRGDLEDPDVIEFCADPSNRPHAQQMFNRWFAVAVRSFGRPGTLGDGRAVELGLRSRTAGEMLEVFLSEMRELSERYGLELPDPDDFGLDLSKEA